MRYLLLILCSATGCETFETPFTPEFYRPAAIVVHEVVQEKYQMEALCGVTPPGKVRLGCAHIPSDAAAPCVIVTYHNASSETLDHERKHCIYGRWHS